ncbi:MAG TPA: type II secretion system F family protein [Clostridia bacterium]|nr:type II secretion system F family protein [Clostridia bacterium]
MGLVLILSLGYFLLYRRAKLKYHGWAEELAKKEFPLRKNFLLMGHFFLQKINYTYKTSYDRKLAHQLAELYGVEKAYFYLQVHWANKIGYLLLMIFFIIFLQVLAGGDPYLLFLGVLVLAAIFGGLDYELKKMTSSRRLRICLDFPDFLNQLILLLNAGLTISNAWQKIVHHNQKESPLYREVRQVGYELEQNKTLTVALEDFARRCRVPEITRFTAVLLQNLKKGNAELVPVLRLQANECWLMRKNTAQRLGEEASTKLLLPMMLMLIAILLIVAAPAILALRNLG